MRNSTVTEDVRLTLDSELKHQADELFAEMGLSFSAACEIFVRQSLLEGCIPFDFLLRENGRRDDPAAGRRA